MWAILGFILLFFLGGCTPSRETGTGNDSPVVARIEGEAGFPLLGLNDPCGGAAAWVVDTSSGELVEKIPLPGNPTPEFPPIFGKGGVWWGKGEHVVAPDGTKVPVSEEFTHDGFVGEDGSLTFLTSEGELNNIWKVSPSSPSSSIWRMEEQIPPPPEWKGNLWLSLNALSHEGERWALSSRSDGVIIFLNAEMELDFSILGGGKLSPDSPELYDAAQEVVWEIEGERAFDAQHHLRLLPTEEMVVGEKKGDEFVFLDNEHARALRGVIEEDRVRITHAYPAPSREEGCDLIQGTAAALPGGNVVTGCLRGGVLHEVTGDGGVVWEATFTCPQDETIVPEIIRGYPLYEW